MNLEISFFSFFIHQFFWTIFSFLLFYMFFMICFKNPVFKALQLRKREESLLQNLIVKNRQDTLFYNEEQHLLHRLYKDKVDSYVVKALSKDEKRWQEEILELKLEHKSCDSTCFNVCVEKKDVEHLSKILLKRYSQ